MGEKPARQLPGMKPWACQYIKDGVSFGIILYGSDPDQIEADHCETLWGLQVVGELLATIEN